MQTPLLADEHHDTDYKLHEIDVHNDVDSEQAPVAASIAITDVSFEVADRNILHKLSATFGPNKLIAIMGASGAGKTTLLNILAGVIRGKGVSGRIQLNGRDISWRLLRKVSAYCLQDDFLFATLTPREMLWDVAQLRLPASVPVRSKIAKVDRLLRLFGLEAVSDVVCGAPGGERGLSGGQRKRLSVALEVLAEPALMLLDEPTSGLDAASAHTLIHQLSTLAKQGHTIVCTIHQPTSKVFQMFDEVMLLARGDIVYHGPVNKVVEFLSRQGLQCPQYYNPADFLIEMSDEQQGSVLSTVVGAYKEEYSRRPVDKSMKELVYPPSRYPASSLDMVKILLKRAMRVLVRDRTVFRLRFMSHVVAGILTGFLWFQQTIDPFKVATVQNRISLLFFTIIFLLLNSVIPTVLTFPQYKAVFEKEHRNNWYSVKAYFIAQTIADIPFQIVLPLIYGTIVYGMTGLRSGAEHVAQFLFICVLQTLVGQSLGVLVSCVAPSVTFAVFAAPISIIPQLLLCGFLANLNQVPIPLRYLQYLSFIRFGFEGLLISQFKDYDIQKGSAEIVGNGVLDQLGFDPGMYARDALVLVAFVVALRIAAYVVLRKKVKRFTA